MTLIMTALAPGVVAQVSDRRLTVNGSLHDDLAIKAICVCCRDARFCLAYTGLAEIGQMRTDIWTFGFLESIEAGALPVGWGASPKRDLSAFNNAADLGAFVKPGVLLIAAGLLMVLLAFLLPKSRIDG
jgi:hypothetical protein